MSYFEYFNRENYPLSDTLSKRVTNISQYTSIFTNIANDISFYTYYTMQPNERLDTISNNLYNTPDHYWTIPLINERIFNTWTELPKDEQTFNDYLKKKYPGVVLTIDEVDEFEGKFRAGEIVAYDIENIYEVLGVYPSLRYIHCVPVSPDRFDPLNDPREVWVLLTGLWNEVNDNIWDDSDIWRDTTEYVITADTLNAAKVESSTPAYLAPAYYVDENENRVPWYYPNARPVTLEEVERNRNEINLQVKVIRPEFIDDVIRRFEEEIRSESSLSLV